MKKMEKEEVIRYIQNDQGDNKTIIRDIIIKVYNEFMTHIPISVTALRHQPASWLDDGRAKTLNCSERYSDQITKEECHHS